MDITIQIAPGIEFEAWAFNGQVPGPTLRAVEGNLIRVNFNNVGRHAHTIHPHLKNLDPEMDGIPQMVREADGRVGSATNLLAFLIGSVMYATDLFVAL